VTLQSPPSTVSPRTAARARRLASADGFSLPEVLVVILIIGVLAAVAIPTLLGTTATAYEVQAKEIARNAATAAETYANDHQSSYANISPAELLTEDPTLVTAASKQHAYLAKASGTATEYSVTAMSTNGDELTLTRTGGGAFTRTCHSTVSKTGCGGSENGTW
jgi:type IV pilus assembly protein PilA